MLPTLKGIITSYSIMPKKERTCFKKFIFFRCTQKKAAQFVLILDELAHYPTSSAIKEDIIDRLRRLIKTSSKSSLEILLKDLSTLMEDFHAHQQLDRQHLEKKILLVDSYVEQNRLEDFASLIKKIILELEKKIEEGKKLDPADFFMISLLNKRLYFHPGTHKIMKEGKELHTALINLNKYYTLDKFRLTSDILVRQQFLTDKIDIHYDDVLKMAEDFEEPIFKLYANLISLFNDYEEESFSKLFSEVKEKMNDIAVFDQGVFIEKLLYLTHKAHETGKTEYPTHLFELFKIGDEQGIFSANYVMDNTFFLNAVSVAASRNELKWAIYFIKKYRHYLKPDTQYETTTLASIYCRFYCKSYEKILREVQRLEKSSFQELRLQARVLCLRVYYELALQPNDNDYFDIIDTYSDNLIRSINRNEYLNRSKKLAINNFVRLLKKMMKNSLDINFSKKDKEELMQKVNNTNPLIAKLWLKQKLKEMEPRK